MINSRQSPRQIFGAKWVSARRAAAEVARLPRQPRVRHCMSEVLRLPLQKQNGRAPWIERSAVCFVEFGEGARWAPSRLTGAALCGGEFRHLAAAVEADVFQRLVDFFERLLAEVRD